jgi:tetratricopeptide (TPR) repeat protein
MHNVIKRLNVIIPSSHYSNPDIWRDYLPHALTIFGRLEGHDTKESSKLRTLVGNCLMADGRISEAIRSFESAYQWYTNQSAREDPDRLRSQRSLAIAYSENGQTSKGVSLLEEVVTIQETALGQEHPTQLGSQHDLAHTYLDNEQADKAVTLLAKPSI